MRRAIFLAVSAAILFSLCGCATDTIGGDDSGVFLPSVQVGMLLGERTPDSPRLELGLARGSGGFKQELGTRGMVVDGVSFRGPGSIDVDATIASGTLRIVDPVLFRNGTVGVEWAAGLGAIQSDITVSNASGSARIVRHTAYGPHGGIALLFRNPELKLGLRVGVDFIVAADLDPSHDRSEILGVYTPSPAFEFMFGWRKISYADFDERDAIDIDIEFSGPAAGLRFAF